MSRRITTFDIAREAGVSRTTVSHILNDQPGVHLSAKTKARVLETARRFGYVANSAAQILVTGRSQSIGLVFPRGDLLAIDAFIPTMIRGLNEVCRARGYRLVMEVLRELSDEQAYLKLANSKRVGALIVINPRRGDRALAKVLKSKFPVLVAGTNDGPCRKTIADSGGHCEPTGHKPPHLPGTSSDRPHQPRLTGLCLRFAALGGLSSRSQRRRPSLRASARHPSRL
jgi:DNA-binding LacI/PurR family transcriptional regulator